MGGKSAVLAVITRGLRRSPRPSAWGHSGPALLYWNKRQWNLHLSEGTPTTRADFRLVGTQLEAEDQGVVTHRVRHQPEGGALEHHDGTPDDLLTEVGRARSPQERVDFIRGLIQGGEGRNPSLLALLLSQALDVSNAWCLLMATLSWVMLETGKREPSLD